MPCSSGIAQSRVDRTLGGAHRHRRGGTDIRGELDRSILEPVALDHVDHEAPFEGLGGIEAAAAEDHLLGAGDTQSASQQLGASPGGKKPDPHLGKPHLGALGRDDQVAGQGELETSTESEAEDGRDRRLRDGTDGLEQAADLGPVGTELIERERGSSP